MGMNFEKHAWWQLHDLQIKFPFVVPSRLDVVQDLVFVLWVFGKGFIQSRRPVDAKIFAVFSPNTDIRVKSGFVKSYLLRNDMRSQAIPRGHHPSPQRGKVLDT
jgi:hypothetical protein